MKIFWSATTNGFYPSDIQYDPLPDDLVEISVENWQLLLSGQGSGKIINSGNNGYPVLTEQPPPSGTEFIAMVEQQKNYLKSTTNSEINWRQDTVDLGISTDIEKSALTEWRKYRVLFNRVDYATAPDIQWPEQPK
ncbi:tail fiber assembly protein [Xenorhabdus sp. TH1]|uniref:tail fiber assembly protein n=1 Tax=Xenorhabdus sp. TH1 TaxID=3130166 RepID=UPI0030CFA1BC